MKRTIPNPSSILAGVAVASLVIASPTLADSKGFKPQRFEKERSVHVNASPDKVYALLNPERRHLWSKKKNEREQLFAGWGKTLSGAMYYAVDKHHGYRWEVMAEDNPDEHLMRWILIYPEVELLVAEIRCASEEGGTKLTMAWSVIGLSADGNEQVKNFFASDSFEKQVDTMGEMLNAYLE